MEKKSISVVIDGKVYILSGGTSETQMQRIAAYVDAKIHELKTLGGYKRLSQEYKQILLSLNIAEELIRMQDELDLVKAEQKAADAELYRLKHEIVDKKMDLDTVNKLVLEYKSKVNELQKRILELEMDE